MSFLIEHLRIGESPDADRAHNTAAAGAGLDATNIAGHGVWAGMATQAAINGASDRNIVRTTGQRSRCVLRRYIRSGELFRDNATASPGH